jgi:hypothetical protein
MHAPMVCLHQAVYVGLRADFDFIRITSWIPGQSNTGQKNFLYTLTVFSEFIHISRGQSNREVEEISAEKNDAMDH